MVASSRSTSARISTNALAIRSTSTESSARTTAATYGHSRQITGTQKTAITKYHTSTGRPSFQ